MAENFSHKAMNSLLESHQLSREAMEKGFDRVQKTIEEMALQVGQLSQQMKIHSQNIGRLEGAIERLTASVDNHLKLAEQQNETAKMQAANISDLTRLVATQSETVNRLLERLAA